MSNSHKPEKLTRPWWQEVRLCPGCGVTRVGGLGCLECGTEGSIEGRSLIVPPNAERTPMLVSPEALKAISDLLSAHPDFCSSGIGYSEFILRAVEAAKEASRVSSSY